MALGDFVSLPRWLRQSRIEQLRFDHAAGHRVRTPQLAGESPNAGQRDEKIVS